MSATLRKVDAIALSEVSRHHHAIATKWLWQSVTIKPPSEDDLDKLPLAGLPQSCLRLAKQLHFHADVLYATARRCLHNKQYADPLASDEELEAMSEHDRSYCQTPFDQITHKSLSWLSRLEDDQLQHFRCWTLGTCIPPDILGATGIVPRTQSQIRSLSLMTDYSCTPCLHRRCSIDLSSFRQLRSLTWKAPNPIHLDALFVAIRTNGIFCDHEDTAAQNFLVQGLLGPDHRLSPLVLPDIRTLVLSQVPVTASLAKMISFESLVSLTLRNCPGWDTFLARAARLKCRIQLTTFELHSETVSPLWTQSTLVEFLGAF
ncbi:hypothetical protein VFPBJ_11458 [Purpureocillium lilacinum]|uniref:F-box-like domain-containing protein n=1 Tax=Purpureocillium lilacinum TaxID=33203 RepID=A0A179F7I0_PURLI|nr:hypothetical protein VFPBJ_11458 [Purpureocillium lilacinum]